jgi:hypothetical protein
MPARGARAEEPRARRSTVMLRPPPGCADPRRRRRCRRSACRGRLPCIRTTKEQALQSALLTVQMLGSTCAVTTRPGRWKSTSGPTRTPVPAFRSLCRAAASRHGRIMAGSCSIAPRGQCDGRVGVAVTLAVTGRRRLFAGLFLSGGPFREYDVAPDDQRFVMISGGSAQSTLVGVQTCFSGCCTSDGSKGSRRVVSQVCGMNRDPQDTPLECAAGRRVRACRHHPGTREAG